MTIPVTYKDREYDFPIEVVPQAYGMKFLVDVNEVLVVFETDDEGNLRAIIPDINNLKEKPPASELLQAIGQVLESVMS